MNEDQKRRLALAGTVAFPPAGQGTAKIKVVGSGKATFVSAETSSPRVSVTRTFGHKSVRAIYEPEKDKWRVMGKSLYEWLCDKGGKAIHGVIYVLEDAQTLLEVSTGMTAAEAAEYYPPMSARAAATTNGQAGYVDGVGCEPGTSTSCDLPIGG